MQNQVLELGAALASIDGDFRRRDRVERLKESPLSVVVYELSAMERTTTSASSVRLIAMAKQVLGGKMTYDAFAAHCRDVTGTA